MSNQGRLLITGATGLVGSGIVEQFPDALVTTRNASRAADVLRLPREQLIEWDPTATPLRLPDGVRLRGVVNLMGESVAKGRWTSEKKRRIRDSRVLGTQHLVQGLVSQSIIPDFVVSASAVGYYGDRSDEILTETSGVGTGFLADTCREWEAAANAMAAHGARVVCLRIGLVLARDDGALPKMIPIFRWGVGGPFGLGRQWYPWIHIDDLVDLVVWAMDKPDLRGPLIASAPEPVRNRTFVAELAKRLKRPALLPVPRAAARLLLGEFAEMLFHSQRAVPQLALDSGFQFRFGSLGMALDGLLA